MKSPTNKNRHNEHTYLRKIKIIAQKRSNTAIKQAET